MTFDILIYLMGMHCANYIHFEPTALRTAAEFVKAYAAGKGIVPTYERLNNETSKQLESYCLLHQPQFSNQYVPPHKHRAN